MAKRTTRPQAGNNANNETPVEGRASAPKRRRTAADRTSAPEALVARAEEPQPTTPEELPEIPEPGDIADRAQREMMFSEPSEEDIRLRAYQRYLERGGAHGSHFDDWLAAERELKRGKST